MLRFTFKHEAIWMTGLSIAPVAIAILFVLIVWLLR